MTGAELKQKLTEAGCVLADLAKQLSISPQHLNQALSAADIKTGLLERIAQVLDVPVSSFYGEPADIVNGSAIATNHSIAVRGSHNNVNGNTAVLEERVKALEALLAEKERVIKLYEQMCKK